MISKTRKHTAFTLVEILIVVIILGILAAIVIPQFSSAAARGRASMLADDLRLLRTQISIFKSQHHDVPPGYANMDPSGAPSEAVFLDHITQATSAAGAVAAPGTPGHPFGPYMREMPVNPINQKSSIRVEAAGGTLAPADSHGWIYQPSTLTFRADSPGSDDGGKAFFDY